MWVGCVLGCLMTAASSSSARADPLPVVPVSYAVDARFLDREHSRIAVDARVAVDVTAGTRQVRLWWPVERLGRVPGAVDERSWRWVFPGEADLAPPELVSVSVGGTDVTAGTVVQPVPGMADVAGADLLVPLPAGVRGRVVLRTRTVVTLPRRFGRLGRVGAGRYLLAPWYPLVVDEAGHHRFSVFHRVRFRGPGAFAVLVGGGLREPGETAVVRGSFAAVAVAPRFHVRTRRLAGVGRADANRGAVTGDAASGPALRVWSVEAPYDPPRPGAEGLDALDDVVAVDRVGLLAAAAEGVPDTMAALDLPPPRRVDVLVFPSRTELAAAAPGMVLASDRIFEIVPIDEARGFHARRFRRALFRHLVGPTVDRVEPLADRAWVADLRARVLADLDEARRRNDPKSPAELLSFAAFHPSVDNLLYARQVPFLDVYFEQGTPPSPFREAPGRARDPRPEARKILGDLRLSLGADTGEALPTADDGNRVPGDADTRYETFIAAVAEGSRPTREVLADVSPRAAADLDSWLAARRVNYRLGEVESTPRPGGGWRHEVTVHRDGDPRPEPVSVLVLDQGGNEGRAVYREGGHTGTVVVDTPEPVDRVVVDPEGRATQDPSLTPGHPRDDDATRWPLRPPLLQGFDLSFSPTDGAVQGFVTFAMRRLYDLESIWQLTFFGDPGTIGGVARYIRGIGPKRHGNARVGFASVGLDLSRLDAGFAGAEQGGWRFGLNAGVGVDRRVFLFDPRQGVNASLGGRVGAVRRDDGSLAWTGALGGRAGVTVGLGYRTALFLLGAAGWTLGDALESELQRIGGIGNLRGFQVGEIVGEGRVSALAELRYTALTDLAMNALHLAWLREVQLALFTGGGGLFYPSEGQANALGLADVGVGVRFHIEYGGVQPGVVAIDLGWPLTDLPDRPGLLNGGNAAPNVYFYFNQFL